jgi:hypothetical protein
MYQIERGREAKRTVHTRYTKITVRPLLFWTLYIERF